MDLVSQWGHPEPGVRGGDAGCPRVPSAPPHEETCSRPADYSPRHAVLQPMINRFVPTMASEWLIQIKMIKVFCFFSLINEDLLNQLGFPFFILS